MRLQEVVEKYGRLPENLIQMLTEYQSSKNTNSISEDELKLFAKELNIPESRVHSVVSFYTLCSVEKRGKYVVQICEDVPCYVNNSVNIVEEFEKNLGVKMGETTEDGAFTLEHTSCLGCCDIAPAVRIGEDLHGNLTPDKVVSIINEYRRKYNESRE